MSKNNKDAGYDFITPFVEVFHDMSVGVVSVIFDLLKIAYKKWNKNQQYHKECWLKISGGIKEGSSRGKCGWYKKYWCDSSYELAYLIWNLDNNISLERNKEGFEYIYNGKKHLFYPDFIVNGRYVEIKNYKSDLTDAKLNYFLL